MSRCVILSGSVDCCYLVQKGFWLLVLRACPWKDLEEVMERTHCSLVVVVAVAVVVVVVVVAVVVVEVVLPGCVRVR